MVGDVWKITELNLLVGSLRYELESIEYWSRKPINLKLIRKHAERGIDSIHKANEIIRGADTHEIV